MSGIKITNMSMEKEFIPYELALALKKLGFDEPCWGYYNVNEGYSIGYAFCYSDRESQPEIGCSAPLYQQAFRWFREKYNIIPNIHSIYTDETHTKIMFWFWFGNYEDDSDEEVFYGTYEETELECLKKLIEIVKNEKL